jgi:fucokinase
VSDLLNYNKPQSRCALLKAVVVCLKIVDLSGEGPGVSSAPSLADQLVQSLSSGLEIECSVSLPMGSGLGTSSILAGALMQAVATACGRPLNQDSITHGVLAVEQLLSSGGGWQDQVGGILPGAKIARSASQLPLRVIVQQLSTAPRTERHLVLIYTGKTRLAKNLLQNVLRRW